MKKRKSLVVSLALALLLVFSAPVALLLNRTAAQADEEETHLIAPVDYFVPVSKGSDEVEYSDYYQPKVATVANGLQSKYASYANKGVLVPFEKNDSTYGPKGCSVELKTTAFNIDSASKDDVLFRFAAAGKDSFRVYKVTIAGKTATGDNAEVAVYFVNEKNANCLMKNATPKMAYVVATGQKMYGGLNLDGTAMHNDGTAEDVSNFSENTEKAVGTPTDTSKEMSIYYDAEEKAIYTDGTDGKKVLVRDLDAENDLGTTDDDEGAVNGNEAAFAGFSGEVTITVSHGPHGGGMETPTGNTPGKYGVVVTALNGIDFSAGINSLGYIESYKKVDGSVTAGDYKSEEFVVSTNVATALPALGAATEGATVTDDEKTGWTTKVYNASREEVTNTVYNSEADNVTFTSTGKYVVVKNKDVKTGEGDDAKTITHVVTYVYSAIETGFENDYRNIFDYKDGDGVTTVGRAGVNLATDLSTGTSTVPEHAQDALGTTGIMLGYKSVKTKDDGAARTDLGKIVAHIPSVNISDNKKDDILISATPVPSTAGITVDSIEVSGILIVVYETADPNNYFAVSLHYYVQNGGHTIHATAAARGQSAFGTRGASATAQNTVINGVVDTAHFGESEYKFSYDGDNKAVYINNTIIRDFDADDNTNGTDTTRVKWSGFETDEVGIMIMNTAGSGNVLVKNVDGNDLTYAVASKGSDGYAVGLNSAIKTDNYNASIRAAIGSTVVVPAPTSKTIVGTFTKRQDITVAKYKVNSEDAKDYIAGTSSFTVAAGVNKIEYLDSSNSVIATAYVYGYENSLADEFTGGTVEQGAVSPLIGIGIATDQLSSAKSVDGLRVIAARPTGTVTKENKKVTVKLNKKLYIGGLSADQPLIDFSMAPEYVSHQLESFAVVIKDENNNTIKINITAQDVLQKNSLAYVGSSYTSSNSPVRVSQNGTDIQLRHNNAGLGNPYQVNNFYYSGYNVGGLALYFNYSTQELKVGENNKGYGNGTNDVLCCFNPTDKASGYGGYYNGDKFSNHTFTSLGDTVEMSFEFTFRSDSDYVSTENNYAKYMAKEDHAAVLIRSIAGQSLVQTDNVYAKPSYSGEGASNRVAASIAKVTGSYAVGDALKDLPEAYYFDFFADGGIATATDYKPTSVKLTNPSEQEVTASTVDGSYSLSSFGKYTLTYTFEDGREVSTTFDVDVKKININNNNGDPHFGVTLDDSSVGCADGAETSATVYRLSKADGAKAVLKFTPKEGYAIKAIQLGSTDQLNGTTLYYDDTDNAYTLTVNYTDAVFADGSVAIVVTTDKYFTVTFDAGSGTAVASQRVFNGGNASEPTDPTCAGYVFKGWYTDSACSKGNEFAFTSTIDSNKKLYAKWVEAFTVTFNSKGGSTVASTGAENGAKITKPTDPTKEHYTFGGWFKEEDLTTAWNFESDTVSAAITLYAKWTPVDYSITYNLDGGTNVSGAPTTYTIETELNLGTPTKNGYTFGGWYTDSALSNSFTYTKGTTSGALELYAKWTAKEYVATFKLGYNGAPADTTAKIYHDGKVTAPTAPTREGYTFDGWFAGDATTAYDFDTTVTGNVTLTAKWTIKTYTVSFSDGVAAQTVNHGDKATAPAAPTKDGYTFGGWFVGDAAYDFDTPVTDNVTIVAKWELITHTVMFNSDGGNAIAPQTIAHGGNAIKPVDPTRVGYKFDGWFVDGATTAYDFDTTVTGNVTLTAKWTAVAADSDTTAGDNKKDDKEGCGKEAIGLLAVVMSALGAALIIKKH